MREYKGLKYWNADDLDEEEMEAAHNPLGHLESCSSYAAGDASVFGECPECGAPRPSRELDVRDALAKCLDCGHEWRISLFEILTCSKCGADATRITVFDLLADGSKGEEYPPPPAEEVA